MPFAWRRGPRACGESVREVAAAMRVALPSPSLFFEYVRRTIVRRRQIRDIYIYISSLFPVALYEQLFVAILDIYLSTVLYVIGPRPQVHIV
jgi:hypothetical protein